MFKFSLIVATLNRHSLLKRCILSLLSQNYKEYEIIVVDQSEEKFNIDDFSKYDFFHYYQIKKKGLSIARNFGIMNSTGQYICLIDDDAVYEYDYLKKIDLLLSKNNYDIIGGTIVDPEKNISISYSSPVLINWKNAFKYLVSPSMVIKKDILLNHPFDENLGVGATFGCGEESDIVFYSLKNGFSVYYSNDYYAYHPVGNNNISRTEKYSYGYGGLLQKIKICYSRKWANYYYFKSIFGNVLRIIIGVITFKKQKIVLAKIKLKNVKKGFLDYRSLFKEHE